MTVQVERRELVTEALAALGFLIAAGALWAAFGFPAPGWNALWLSALCAALARIELQLEEGHTRPVVLAVVPMLLLLPPATVPLLVAAAHALPRLPRVLAGRAPPWRLLMLLGDCWFALPPALLVALWGDPAGPAQAALLIACAATAQVAIDFVVSALRLWAAIGLDPRDDLRAYGWVYLVDALLMPVALLAGLAGREHPAAVGVVAPLALLIAVFARERRGRIETAQALQRLTEESRDRLHAIVRNASDLIAIVRPDGHLISINGSFAPIFGEDAEAALQGSLLEHVHPDDAIQVRRFLTRTAAAPAAESVEAEWRMRYADGSYRHVSAVARNLSADEHIGGIVVTARDVEARKAFEEQLRHRAFHDELTGLANRALFFDRVEHALLQAARTNTKAAVLFIDLDDFKLVNDRLGHAAGDAVLREVAARLGACTRSADTVARLGGDEFGVLMEGVAAPLATQVGERVLAALQAPIAVADDFVVVSASVGVALSAPDVGDAEAFLRRGDRAMYEAKRGGKRRMALYTPELADDDESVHRQPAWFAGREEQRAEIVSLLEDPNGLTVVFQPIVDLRTGRVAGYEALARFNRTPYQPPDQWFAKAHRCGLGYALEAKALAAAFGVPARPCGTYLSVNVSPSSLTVPEVRDALPERLEWIVVEITENELVSGDPEVSEAIADLRARGARIAVDDTGSGYAGLTHVMRLAPDVIKLDRALITGIHADPAKAALVSSVVRYARDIDATVLGEGIETPEELTRLAELDVSYGQGYLIARPAPPWATVSSAAADACRAAARAAFSDELDFETHERRLEQITRLLVGVRSAEDLHACLRLLTAELRADRLEIVPGGPAEAQQLVVGDPSADPVAVAELIAQGYQARLSLPIGDRGRLHAYSRSGRPWTRFHINRGRIIAHQLVAVLERCTPAPAR